MKLTNWFKPSIKPVHIGWYETQMKYGNFGYSYWDGFSWSCQHYGNSCSLLNAACWNGAIQDKKWRGIAK